MVRRGRQAMATRFEVALWGEDKGLLRGVAEQALNEVAQLEAQLSFYRPESELSGLNQQGASGWVHLEPQFFALLQRAAELSHATGGAFDPTVAPLLRCWGFAGERGRMPPREEIDAALACVGVD